MFLFQICFHSHHSPDWGLPYSFTPPLERFPQGVPSRSPRLASRTWTSTCQCGMHRGSPGGSQERLGLGGLGCGLQRGAGSGVGLGSQDLGLDLMLVFQSSGLASDCLGPQAAGGGTGDSRVRPRSLHPTQNPKSPFPWERESLAGTSPVAWISTALCCARTRPSDPWGLGREDDWGRGPPAGVAVEQRGCLLLGLRPQGWWCGGRSGYLAQDFWAQPVGGLEEVGILLYPCGEGGGPSSGARRQGHPGGGNPQRHLPGAHEGAPGTCLRGRRHVPHPRNRPIGRTCVRLFLSSPLGWAGMKPDRKHPPTPHR